MQLASLIEVIGTARQLADQNKNCLLVETQENLGTLTVEAPQGGLELSGISLVFS